MIHRAQAEAMGAIEGLPLPLTDIGAGALVVLVVLMILTDRLVTRKRLEEAKAEAQQWREMYLGEVALGHKRDEQVAELVEVGRTTVRFMEALPPAVREYQRGRDG